MGLLAFGLLCLVLAFVMLAAPQRPRLAPMLFCVLAAFAPDQQGVFAAVRDLAGAAGGAGAAARALPGCMAGGELVYFAAIWLYLAGLEQPGKGLPAGWYAVAIWVHVIATAAFCGVLLWISWWPDRDPLRPGGSASGSDPGGGVLDGAPDRRRLRIGPARPVPGSAPEPQSVRGPDSAAAT